MQSNSRVQSGRAALLLVAASMAAAAALAGWAHASDPRPVSRVEVVLHGQYRNAMPSIKQEFIGAGMGNVHVQFSRTGHPPRNIGFGREVPADKAREALKLAIKYNQDVTILLPERLFPPRFITIASSNFDDTVEYPIDRDALVRLQDPSLTTEQFHALYRELTSVPLKPAGRY